MNRKWKRALSWLLAIALLIPAGPLAPVMAEEADENIVYAFDFETGTDGWFGRGDATVTQVTYEAHSGNGSLFVSGRRDTWQGPGIYLDLQPGVLYTFSVYAKLPADASEETEIQISVEQEGREDERQYVNIASATVGPDKWVEIKGTTILDEGADRYQIYVEAPDDPTIDFYIDTFRVTTFNIDDVDKSGLYFDFEDGDLNGWQARNGTDPIQVTDAENHTPDGKYSLLTEPSEQYQGPLLNIEGKMAPGHIYDFSVWVKMKDGIEPTLIRMSLQLGPNGPYHNITADTLVTDEQWVELSARYTLETVPESLAVYVELVDETDQPKPFYIDDFRLVYVGSVSEPPPVQTDIPRLRDLYEPYFKIGAAVENNHLQGRQKELLDLHYNSLVAENVMKPEYMSRGYDDFYFEQGDVLANYVREYNKDPDNETTFDLRFHTLVWHSQGADWMLQDDEGNWLEPNEENKQLVLDRLENYIRAAIRQYADVITDIDVVNEVIDENQPDGMRNSYWYQITGKDFIKHAFRVAHDELDKLGKRNKENGEYVRLYINDYNTHIPRKRDVLYELVMELREEGVPIDGIGHQTHINIDSPSIQEISDSIRLFGEAGFDNQITELDMSIYTDNTTVYDPVPEEILIKQGYRYKELFEELIRLDEMGRSEENPEGWISNVTLWGIADNHTWLHNRGGVTRQDAPFPFDKNYQAKPAYWGMVVAVDDSYSHMLPINPKEAITPQGTPDLNKANDLRWSTVPPAQTYTSGSLQGTVKTLWDDDHLYVRVEVQDDTISSGDQVEIFVENADPHVLTRTDAAVVETDDGYVVQTAIKLDGANEMNRQVRLDVRITDAGNEDDSDRKTVVSWSDPRNAQDEDQEGYGRLTFVGETKLGQAMRGTPDIDGDMDSVWNNAPVYTTDVIVEQNGDAEATAEFRVLWDDHRLYVYAEVTDSLLTDASENPWEQDSVEIFVDQNNGKTSNYQADDGQYRVNFNNERSLGGNAVLDNFITATKLLYDEDGEPIGYAVEAAIVLDHIEPKAGDVIGFDFQVNNDEDGDGRRDSVFIWSDPTGLSYTNTSRLGVMELTSPSARRSSRAPVWIPPRSGQGTELVAVVDADGKATITLHDAALQAALDRAEEGRVKLEVQGTENANALSVIIPGHLMKNIAEADIAVIEIDAGIVIVELPFSLLFIDDEKGEVILNVARVDSDSLPAKVREKVGHYPVYELILLKNGDRITTFGANEYVRVSYPFSLSAGLRPAQIVIYHIADDDTMTVIKNGRYNASTGNVEFLTNHFSYFTAIPVQVHFTDLDQAAWAEDSIIALGARGIVKGMTSDLYMPNQEVTRAEFVQMLVQALDLKAKASNHPFDDVKQGAWYESAILQAYQLGIVYGRDDGTFGVHDNIQRQEMAVMTYRALQAAGIDLKPSDAASELTDAAAIADYAREAVIAMHQAGIISGMPDGSFAPKETATRAQAAVILNQLLNRLH